MPAAQLNGMLLVAHTGNRRQVFAVFRCFLLFFRLLLGNSRVRATDKIRAPIDLERVFSATSSEVALAMTAVH